MIREWLAQKAANLRFAVRFWMPRSWKPSPCEQHGHYPDGPILDHSAACRRCNQVFYVEDPSEYPHIMNWCRHHEDCGTAETETL